MRIKKMTLGQKIFWALVIIILVSLIAYYSDNKWVMFFYSTLLGLFANEIKEIALKLFYFKGQIRVSYAYLFRILIGNIYLLVKDEQGRNNYHPVGGVYKYNPDEVNIAEQFEGNYDGSFGVKSDTDNDLRLIISRRRFRYFDDWFIKGWGRENGDDLSREFREELIDRGYLSEDAFKRIKYRYIGSAIMKNKNESLNMQQVRRLDIYDIILTEEQKKQLTQLLHNGGEKYIFATENDIENGFSEFAGQRYEIAPTSKYILPRNAHSLRKDYESKTVSVPVKKTV